MKFESQVCEMYVQILTNTYINAQKTFISRFNICGGKIQAVLMVQLSINIEIIDTGYLQ